MAPCVRGLRRRICRHKALSPASWQGELAGHLISQHPGLGIYYQLFSHLRVTWEGRRESGVGATKPPTDAAALPSSAASPTSLRNNGVAVRRAHLIFTLIFTQTPPRPTVQLLRAGPRGQLCCPRLDFPTQQSPSWPQPGLSQSGRDKQEAEGRKHGDKGWADAQSPLPAPQRSVVTDRIWDKRGNPGPQPPQLHLPGPAPPADMSSHRSQAGKTVPARAGKSWGSSG